MIGLALLEHLNGTRLSFQIELVGFSEEEGVRFKTPFIGSRALVRQAGRDLLSREDANGVTVEQAIVDFGLQPDRIGDAAIDSSAFGFLEFHIEQGPVLESLDRSLGIVNAIAGQTRGEIIFSGNANHAGTTPMHLRRDALAGASEWIGQVEDIARSTRNLVATVGRIEVTPGAGNVIASRACMSLDIRHSNDEIRITATKTLVDLAHSIAQQRRLCCEWRLDLEQAAVRLDPALSNMAVEAVRAAGSDPVIMVSGAGHDAMILAEHIPSSMIFLRSPGGVSHHPDETVKIEDVHDAIAAGICFLNSLDTVITGTNA
jgi:allantoate deiminase